jgi:aminoacrylate hydrolase
MPRIRGTWVEEAGSGPPLFFIPGLGGLARGFRAQFEGLADRFRVISYDRLGCGRSLSPTAIVQTVEDMADEALMIFDELRLGSVDVVGHSTGGAIALSLAARHPDRIARMAVSAAWAHPDPGFRACFDARKALLLTEGPAAYLRLANAMTFPEDWAAANREALEAKLAEDLRDFPAIELLLARIDAICRFDIADQLPRIGHPTLVMCAEDDRVVPVTLSRAIAGQLKQAKLHIFATGGHATPRLEAESFNRLINGFFTSTDDVVR